MSYEKVAHDLAILYMQGEIQSDLYKFDVLVTKLSYKSFHSAYLNHYNEFLELANQEDDEL